MKTYNFKNYFVMSNAPEVHTADLALVYFDSAGYRLSTNEEISVQEALDRCEPVFKAFINLKCSIYFVVPKVCSWYQQPDIYAALDLIKQKNKKIYTMGYSMGGFAAVNFSYYLQSFFIAFQPQYKLDFNFPLYEFYKKCLNNIIHVFTLSNIEENKNIEQQGYVFYDPHNEVDRFHAIKIQQHTKAELLEVPYGEHDTSRTINRFYKLHDLIYDVLNGKFSAQGFRQLIDCNRIYTFPGYMSAKLTAIRQDHEHLKSQVNLPFEDLIRVNYECREFYAVTELARAYYMQKGPKLLSADSIKHILQSFLACRLFFDFLQFYEFCKKYSDSTDPDCIPVLQTALCNYYFHTRNYDKFKKEFSTMRRLKSKHKYFSFYLKYLDEQARARKIL